MRRSVFATAVFTLCWAALACAPARAQQDLTITAETDKTTVSLSDSLTLSVTVTGGGADLPEPRLPSLPNFNSYSSGQSNNISIINGRVFSAQVYTYNLTPRFVGQATIKPIAVTSGGRTYQTNPIEITVVPASQQAQPAARQGRAATRRTAAQRSRRTQANAAPQADGAQAFARAYISNKTPYVNEQVNLTVRFYTSVSLLGNPQYSPPTMRGMLAEDLPPVRTGMETINGRAYHYSEIKTALFGATAGPAAIDSARVQYQPRNDSMIDPDMPDFFQRFFAQGMGNAQTREAVTRPFTINIRPLPETGKPASFSGAVGKYSASASVDVKELKAGEALNFIITVSGTGNLKTIAAPKLPDLPNFRVYDTMTSLNMTKNGDLVQGSKTFKTILIPKTSGLMQLPPAQFSYFDPSDEAYHTVQTQPIQIKVNPGAPQAQAVYSNTSGASSSVTTVGEDIRYIAENKAEAPLALALRRISALGKLNYIPLALLALSAIAALVFNRGGEDESLSKFRKAYASAKSPLKTAARLFSSGKAGEGAAALSEALSTYLCGKLGCPLGSLRLKEILERLRNTSVLITPETLERLENLWQELELLRFAPTQVDHARLQKLPDEVLALLRRLEKELKK